jgi:hypothetical protein
MPKPKILTISKETLQPIISTSTVDLQPASVLNKSVALETATIDSMSTYVMPFMLDSYTRHNDTHEIFKIRNSANDKIETIIGVSQVPPEPVSAVIIINVGIESVSPDSEDSYTFIADDSEESSLGSTEVPFELETAPDYVADAAVLHHVKSIGELPSPFWDGNPKIGYRTNLAKNSISGKSTAMTAHSVLKG